MAEGRATYEIKVDARGAQQTLDGVVKGALPGFEKLSGSINAATGLLGGMGGVAGKAFGTIKQMGEAFLVGGPVGIGLAAGAVAIGLIAEKWYESENAAQAAADAAAKHGNEIENTYVDAVKEGTKQLKALNDELETLGLGSTQKRLLAEEKARVDLIDSIEKRESELADFKAQAAEVTLAQIDAEQERRRKNNTESANYRKGQKELDRIAAEERKALIDPLEKEINARERALEHERNQLEISEKRFSTLTDIAAGEARIEKEKEEARAREKAASDAKSRRDRDASEARRKQAQEEDDFFRRLEEARRNTMKGVEGGIGDAPRLQSSTMGIGDVQRSPTEIASESSFAMAEKEKTKLLAKELKERKKIEEEAEKQRAERYRDNQEILMGYLKSAMTDYAMLIQSTISSGFEQYLDVVESFAAGQEVQFDAIAAGFIRSVGTQLAGIGIKQLFEGGGALAMGMLPGGQAHIPGALMLLSSGSAALAAGTAMATTGAVWQGTITRSAGGGAGSGGGGSSSSAPTGRTSSRGRDSGVPDDSQNVSMVIIGGTFLGDPSDGARRFEQNRRRQLRNVHVTGMA